MEDQSLRPRDETEIESATVQRAEVRDGSKKKKSIKVSKYGIEYPSLPPAVVKRLAQNFAKANGAKGQITPDAMKAIMQASDWFFEQLGEDLQAYAKHAGRKTIDESDVLTLMRRYGTIYRWVSRIVLYMADALPGNGRSTRISHHLRSRNATCRGSCCKNCE
jgi:histone H3/H4